MSVFFNQMKLKREFAKLAKVQHEMEQQAEEINERSEELERRSEEILAQAIELLDNAQKFQQQKKDWETPTEDEKLH